TYPFDKTQSYFARQGNYFALDNSRYENIKSFSLGLSPQDSKAPCLSRFHDLNRFSRFGKRLFKTRQNQSVPGTIAPRISPLPRARIVLKALTCAPGSVTTSRRGFPAPSGESFLIDAP